jgi:hypothetical protein
MIVARYEEWAALCYRPAVHVRSMLAGWLLASACATAAAGGGPPYVGFTLHWDFFASQREADRLVAFAIDSGARIVNVVPPPHIWEQPESVAILKRVFAVTAAHGVGVVLNRIDGSSLPGPDGERTNWLYSNVLTERGRLPSGQPTPDFFLATVGKPDYERWLREETAYYAENFSSEPNLLAFGVGLFNEPFVSQRGSLLCFDDSTDCYEIGQYTRYTAAVWHHFLAGSFGGIGAVNRRFRTDFRTLDAIPMPISERDPAFGDAGTAYFDFVSAINQWVVARIEECRSLWHARAQRDVPFVLQLSGYVPEKFEKGRAAFVALDIFDWMRRADGLGLSAYTNCEYPDWGHASVRAMVAFLRLGELLRKPILVLESGAECHGAVLDPRELCFISDAVRPLTPTAVIYEFLKTSYDERSAASEGKLLGADFRPRAEAVVAVQQALRRATRPVSPGAAVYVLDDLDGLPADAALLASRKQLAQLAMVRSLTFVPERNVGELPAGATLFVPSQAHLATLQGILARHGVEVEAVKTLLKPGSSPTGARPR